MLVPAGPLFSFIAAVGHADGRLSKHELHLLHHITETFLDEALSVDTWNELVELGFEAAKASMRSELRAARSLPLWQRLLLLTIGYDFSAVDGVDPAELAVLKEAGAELELSPRDQDAIYRSINPGAKGAPLGPGSASFRAVHVGPDPSSDFRLLAPGQMTFFRIGAVSFVRVRDVRKAAFLDGQPIPIRGLAQLGARSNLTLPPLRLTMANISAMLDADETWQPASASEDGDEEPPSLPSGLSLWRRGALSGVKAARSGFSINGQSMPVDALMTLLPGDRLTDAETDFGRALEAEDITAPSTPAGDENPEDEQRPKSFEVDDISICIGKSVILDRISFSFRRKEKVAIIGPSGSGKTTLLEVLSGHRLPHEVDGGSVHAVFEDRRVPLRALRTRIALVPQDDIINPFLSVREHIEFAAALRTGGPPPAQLNVVEDAIAKVDLADKAELKVGTPENRILSGGQRRRVGVAQEMVASPDMILLDEPLSGLSSQDARNLSAQFTGLAAEGAAVVVVVHQPSREVLSSFDRLVVLDRGGKLIFSGPPSEGTRYFRHLAGLRSSGEVEDHPDVILAVVEQSGQNGRRRFSPDYWRTLFQLHEAKERPKPSLRRRSTPPSEAETETDVLKPKVPGGLVFKTLFRRDGLARLRNRQALAMSVLAPPLLGFLVALVTYFYADGIYTYADNSAFVHYLRLLPIMAFFFGMSGSGTEFVVDRRRIQHERRIGISVSYVLLSKFLVLGSFVALEACLLIVPGLLLMDYPGALVPMVGLTFLVGLSGVASGLLVSALAPNLKVAFIFVPVLLIPQIVFGGLIPYSEMSPLVRARGGISEHEAPLLAQPLPTRWAAEGLVVAAVRPCLAARCRLESTDAALAKAKRACWNAKASAPLAPLCTEAEVICARLSGAADSSFGLEAGCRALREGTLFERDCRKDRKEGLSAISFCLSARSAYAHDACNNTLSSVVKSASKKTALSKSSPVHSRSDCVALQAEGEVNVFQASVRRYLGFGAPAEFWSALVLSTLIVGLLLLTLMALWGRQSSSI